MVPKCYFWGPGPWTFQVVYVACDLKMAAARAYTVEEAVEAIFQDSGSEFGGDASDSDFKEQ